MTDIQFQLIALTIALVEGLKQTKLPKRFNMLAAILIGAALASVVEFAPDIWERVVPILTVGLASAGLYSIGKRAGGAYLNRNNGPELITFSGPPFDAEPGFAEMMAE